MKKTILFGGSGFFGPIILKKYPEIISVGRTKPPKELKNKHIYIKNLNHLNKLDKINFDKVIFLIGSSNHHKINRNINIGIKYNFDPLIKIMEYLKNKKINFNDLRIQDNEIIFSVSKNNSELVKTFFFR